VRDYAAPVVFRALLRYDSVGTLMSTVLGHLDTQPREDFLHALQQCTAKFSALSRFADPECTVAHRLLELREVRFECEWRVHLGEDADAAGESEDCADRAADAGVWADADAALRLEWLQPSSGPQPLRKSLSISALLDFQSKLALARSQATLSPVDTQAAATSAWWEEADSAVQQFVEQLQWLRELCRVLHLLATAGQPQFTHVNLRYPITVPVQRLRDAVRHAKLHSVRWRHDLPAALERYYVLNLLPTTWWWELVHLLDSSVRLAAPQPRLHRLVAELRSLFVLDETSSHAAARLLSAWQREWGGTVPAPTTCESEPLDRAGRGVMRLQAGFSLRSANASWVEEQSRPAAAAASAAAAPAVPTAAAVVECASVAQSDLVRDRAPPYSPISIGACAELLSVPPQSTTRGAHLLNAVGRLLQGELGTAKSLQRCVSAFDGEGAGAGAGAGTGVDVGRTQIGRFSVVVSRDRSSCFVEVMARYALAGSLPERETMLVCSPATDLASLLQFVYRWKNAHLHCRAHQLYSLVDTHLLSHSLRGVLLTALRAVLCGDVVTSASARVASARSVSSTLTAPTAQVRACAPLLAVVSQSHRDLFAQVAHDSLLGVPNAERVVADASSALSSCAFLGRSAGVGKSFAVRRLAHSQERRVVVVPVYHASTFVRFLRSALDRLDSPAHAQQPLLLHLDLHATLTAEFLGTLFEFVVLRGVIEPRSGTLLSVATFADLLVAVELSADLCGPLRALCAGLLRCTEVSATSNTFCSSSADLRAGMTATQYRSALHDGSSPEMRAQQLAQLRAQPGTGEAARAPPDPRPANAFQRLQYVCLALVMLEQSGGRFPYVYEGPELSPLQSLRLSSDSYAAEAGEVRDNSSSASSSSSAEDAASVRRRRAALLCSTELDAATKDLPSARCFELVCAAADLRVSDGEPPSLWTIWSFVNVFYWQLRSLHLPGSPLNLACQRKNPEDDPLDTRDWVEIQARRKGEVCLFLQRTSRALAMRQVCSSHRVAACRLRGQSTFGKGLWWRTDFDHEGKPCFLDPNESRYLFYRHQAACWVINNYLSGQGVTYYHSTSDDLSAQWLAGYERGDFCPLSCWS
jgi:hypothetical protein